MPFIIDILYFIFILFAGPVFIYRMLRRGKYIKSLPHRLGSLKPLHCKKRRIWLHGVSVGEIKAAFSLVRTFEERLPDWEVVLSTTTPTGQEVAQKTYPNHEVIYFPLDLSCVVNQYLRQVNPDLIILMELELWPNFLLISKKRRIPIIVVNGRITARSFKNYKRYLSWGFARATSGIDCFAVQSELYAQRFHDLGIPQSRVSVTGNMKFDAVDPDNLIQEKANVQNLLQLPKGARVILGGSTHSPEEQHLLDAYLKLRSIFPDIRLIVVPRHPVRADEISSWISNKGLVPIRKTHLDKGLKFGEFSADMVLIGDTMGELGKLYTVSDIVFIGGSLIDHGGQNLLEPASLGKAVLVGPSMYNFPETDEFISYNAVKRISDSQELTHALESLLLDGERAVNMGRKARELVYKRRGATLKNFELCKSILFRKESI